MRLMNKAILVTGAASGIGRTCALMIAEQGGKVALSDINIQGGEETARMILDNGGEAFFMRVDVTRADEIKAFAQAAAERFGGLDGAVNNAGVSGLPARTHEIDELNWDFVLNINLKGVWLCMKAEIPLMREGHGSIVNISSAAGLNGLPNAAHYTASKHGVVGLTKAAALEYGRQGLRINAVCPGFIETPMVAHMNEVRPGMVESTVRFNPMKRLGEPREVATAVCWLLSDEASFVNGHAMSVDGGIVAG